VRIGDYQLAVSDIFGASLPGPLFLLAGVMPAGAVLPETTAVDLISPASASCSPSSTPGPGRPPNPSIGPIGIDSAIALALYVIANGGFATFGGI